jgi:superkiller protein 3
MAVFIQEAGDRFSRRFFLKQKFLKKTTSTFLPFPFSILLLITFLLSLLTLSRNITWGNEISLWKDCIAKAGTKARAYRILADAFQKEKKWNEAIFNYKRSLEIEPSSPWTLNNLAGVYEALGFLDKAMDLYEEASRRYPEFADALNNMGNIAMKKKKMDEAIRYLSLAASKKVNPVCYYNLGTVYLETKKLDDALIWMKKARDLNEDFSPVHANLGMIYYLKNYSEAAIAELKRALEINPDQVEAHVNLGIIYYIDMKLKDDRIALRHLRRALELAPDFSKADILKNIIKEIEKK